MPFAYWHSPRTRPTSANLCRWAIDHYEIPGGQPDWWGLLQDRSAALEALLLELDFASWAAFFLSLSLSRRQGIEQGLSKGMAVTER